MVKKVLCMSPVITFVNFYQYFEDDPFVYHSIKKFKRKFCIEISAVQNNLSNFSIKCRTKGTFSSLSTCTNLFYIFSLSIFANIFIVECATLRRRLKIQYVCVIEFDENFFPRNIQLFSLPPVYWICQFGILWSKTNMYICMS